MSDAHAPDDPSAPFHEWLGAHRHGRLSEELAEILAELLTAVGMTGKPGDLTLKLRVEPKGRTVVVLDDVKAKVPQPDREASIYWITADGALVRDDPTQGRLFNRPEDVDPATGEIEPNPRLRAVVNQTEESKS